MPLTLGELLNADPGKYSKTALGWGNWATAVEKHAGNLDLTKTKVSKRWNGDAHKAASSYVQSTHGRLTATAATLRRVEQALNTAYTGFLNAHNDAVSAKQEAEGNDFTVDTAGEGTVRPAAGHRNYDEDKRAGFEKRLKSAVRAARNADSSLHRTLTSLRPGGTNLGGTHDGGGNSGGGYDGASSSGAPVVSEHGYTTLPASALDKVNGNGKKVLEFARHQLGKPYIYGGNGPVGYDCSGLTQHAWAAAGVDIPRTSDQQWWHTPHVPKGSEQPGDLVYFDFKPGHSGPGHVGIVLDPKAHTMIVAPHTGTDIQIQHYNRSDLVGFTRPGAH